MAIRIVADRSLGEVLLGAGQNRSQSGSGLKMKVPAKMALNSSPTCSSSLVICCSDFADPRWRWIEGPCLIPESALNLFALYRET